jgi:hypothetical protein
MTQREEFEAWWEEFSSAHDEWRFADSAALRWAAWQAAQAAQPAPTVPDGYVLVPVEPTAQMMERGSFAQEYAHDDITTTEAGNVYRAMIAAAPHAAPSTKEAE